MSNSNPFFSFPHFVRRESSAGLGLIIMSKLREAEKAVEEACQKGEIPGLVLAATDRTGNFHYARAFGRRSVREGTDQSPLEYESVQWMASCTKLITSIAAMQCVERGLLSLDAGIYDVLPEFKGKEIIKGFHEDGSPILEQHKATITLRHLLNHSSGIAYDETHPKLLAWLKYHKRKTSRSPTIAERYGCPLVFEPGENWFYGAGIDWAGKMVERVNGGIPLQEYFEKNIFERLGVEDIAFEPFMKDRPSMLRRRADMSKRDQDDWKHVKRSNAWLQYMETEDCFGGLGCWATAGDYLKVLRGLLTTDTDGKLLKKESVEEFFKPSLTDAARSKMNKMLQISELNSGMGGMPTSIVKDWGLGGQLNMSDVDGRRKAGTSTWTGMANWIWFVDRKTGICGLAAAQLLPPGDQQIVDLFAGFEEGLYEIVRAANIKL